MLGETLRITRAGVNTEYSVSSDSRYLADRRLDELLRIDRAVYTARHVDIFCFHFPGSAYTGDRSIYSPRSLRSARSRHARNFFSRFFITCRSIVFAPRGETNGSEQSTSPVAKTGQSRTSILATDEQVANSARRH